MSKPATSTPDESLVQHGTRSTKNFFTSCFGCIQTVDEHAKIKYKETQLASRQKTFGVAYLTLVEEGATQEQLDACVKEAQDDLKKIKAEIEELKKEIDRVKTETQKKIVQKPGATAAVDTPPSTTTTQTATATTTPAETSAEPAPTPTEAPAPAPATTN